MADLVHKEDGFAPKSLIDNTELERLFGIEKAAIEVLTKAGCSVNESRREFARGELKDIDELEGALEALRAALEK